MPAGFRKFEHCMSYDEVDLKNDNFQFISTGDDDVCITELSLNNQKIMTGRNRDRKSFWLETGKSECTVNSMTTNEITIRNGMIVSSACEQCPDSPDQNDSCESKVSCDQTWTQFHRSRTEYGKQVAKITDLFADFYDPFVNGLISEQCSNSSTIDVRLRSNKKEISTSGFIFDITDQMAICKDNVNESCPEFEIRFCCERNNQDIEWISSPKEYDDVESMYNKIEKLNSFLVGKIF